MKVDGSGACSAIKIEAEVDPEKGEYLPSYRLPDRNRHRISGASPDTRRDLEGDRHAGDVSKDHCRE
jgi:hypothetical protein